MRGPRVTGNLAAPGSLIPARDPARNPEAAAATRTLPPAAALALTALFTHRRPADP